MKIGSSWIFDCLPEDIYPHFFCSTMDNSYPLAFRHGIPKPISCKVLEGEAKIGNTRQYTTDKGYIQQNIIELEENHPLVNQIKDNNVWCINRVSFLQDSFMLEKLGNNKTRGKRVTELKGVIHIPVISTIALWFSLKQAHRYASNKWCRLSTATKADPLGLANA